MVELRYFSCLLVFILCIAFAHAEYIISDITYGTGTPDEIHLKVLSNTVTSEELRIVTDLGGRVEELHLRQKSGSLASVLANHDRDARAVRENFGWKGTMLIPFANRIKNGTYVFDGKIHYLPINEPAKQNAIHGFMINKSMRLVSSETTTDKAQIVLSYSFDGSDPGYPYHLALNISYTLSEHKFTMTITARNDNPNQHPLPFYVGFHPYFLVSDVSKTVIEFDNCTRWGHVDMSEGAPREGNLIPTGQVTETDTFSRGNPIGGTIKKPTYFDDEYVALDLTDKCDVITQKIYDPVAGHEFHMTFGQEFPFTQVFTGPRELWDWNAIAMEPMSAACDAFNNQWSNLTVLSAGDTWQGTFSISSPGSISPPVPSSPHVPTSSPVHTPFGGSPTSSSAFQLRSITSSINMINMFWWCLIIVYIFDH